MWGVHGALNVLSFSSTFDVALFLPIRFNLLGEISLLLNLATDVLHSRVTLPVLILTRILTLTLTLTLALTLG